LPGAHFSTADTHAKKDPIIDAMTGPLSYLLKNAWISFLCAAMARINGHAAYH